MYEPVLGEWFPVFVERVKQTLKNSKLESGVAKFNGVIFNVSSDSNTDDLSTIYNLKLKLKSLEK